MRLAPVPMFFACNPISAIEQAAESSRTTHGAPAAVDACRYFAGLIVGALNGVNKDELLSSRYSPDKNQWATRPLHPEIDAVAAGSFKQNGPARNAVSGIVNSFGATVFKSKATGIQGSGYVVKSLEAALWAFFHSTHFRDGCLLAVNLGDDADTTGAIYGQLAGAFYGEQAIPAEWRAKLTKRSLIESFADSLFKLAHDQA